MGLSRRLKCSLIILAVLVVVLFILTFVIFPLAFMFSLKLKQLLLFTNINLPSSTEYYETFNLTAYRNFYLPVKDCLSNKTIFLGVWHILPQILINASKASNFSYRNALKYSNISVLLYFHGSGSTRSYFKGKYTFFRNYFHIISFDYRDFADSTSAELLENTVENDCLQLYEWLLKETSAPIFIWGHSLGSAISSKTVLLSSKQPKVLVLEAPFTSLRDELYVHPFGRIFAWLPWFKATIVYPLEEAGFYFNTAEYLLNTTTPIMIINSKTDNIVDYNLGVKLFEIILRQNNTKKLFYYQFPSYLDYEHNFIYDDPSFSFIIGNFKRIALNANVSLIDTPL